MEGLVERLTAAVAGRYTIEHELGRGGMATVYLAQDLKHHRPVAIKVLKPELAAALGPERFLREIAIAAGLTHPHIVALYDSGDANGILYYVMPYVEGESLRNRLDREGPLPLVDALRIAADVAEALSYAHARAVVHRDIKPENILLEGGRAVVADFGIARAITQAAGDRLTQTGVALGTPVYMSPEQAGAEPRIDGRSDIYSLGCVVYEMLAGHPPFTGVTVQEVLARHSMDAVPSLRAARRAVPESVEAAIRRALGKAPVDRFATALQFAEALSHGPEQTSVTRLLGTIGVFGLASVAVLAVVYGLMVVLGLPDWVFGGAIVLLLLGLPVVAVTALVERRRAQAATQAGAVPLSSSLRAWFTWRRATLGGVFAFSGLGFVTAAYMAMRLLGIGPVGTLIASGVLKTREPLILADFANRSPDSTLGPSLTAAVRVDLSQSPTVKLVDAAGIRDALRRMERPTAAPLTAGLAREVAQRENVKAVVTGAIDPLGKGYVLSASVVGAADGHVLTALRETATDAAALIGAVDRLSRKLRERIGESLRSIRASEPLEQVTTSSFDALRKYSAAARAENDADYDRAAAAYREATAIDPQFAMAYRKLSVVLWNSGASESAVAAAATQAFRHRDRLPPVERYLAIARYYEVADYDWHKAASAYRSALQEDPDNTVALNNLALTLNLRRQWSEAETLAVRATNVSPNVNFSVNTAAAQIGQGRYADADATLNQFARRAPYNRYLLEARSALESARGDYAGAERILRQLPVEQQGNDESQATFSSGLAWLDEVRGKLAQAARDLDDFMAASERRALARTYVEGAIWQARLDVRFRHHPLAGSKTLAAALARHPLASMPADDRPYTALAVFYAETGMPELARRLLAEYERLVPEQVRRRHPERLEVPGAIALAEGRPQDAIVAYRAWSEAAILPTEGLFELAEAYERAHQPDSALAVYERSVSTPGLRTPLLAEGSTRDVGLARTVAATFKRLGELYEARGDRAHASDYYGRFVDLWKDADPELQPIVAEARTALRRLRGGARALPAPAPRERTPDEMTGARSR